MGDKHGWNSWNEYKSAHDGYVRHFITFFILKDELIFNYSENAIYIEGVLYCQNGFEISTFKRLDVRRRNGRVQVRTAEYKYHVAQRIAGELKNLFRYDNIHRHKGHPDTHHVHVYDENGEDTVTHIGYDNWRTFDKVIEETYKLSTQ